MTGSYFHKKIILILALAVFFAGGFFPINKASAETAPPSRAEAAAAMQAAAKANGTVDAAQAGRDATNAALAAGTTRAQNGSAAGAPGEIYCFDFGGAGLVGARFSPTGCIAMGAFVVLGIASWVLWLSAILFNATIDYTLNMASFIKDVPIVALGWTTFRDVANLFFVFIILYIAINTIVGNEGYGIKKLLGKVIFTAMLVNFSLFFTQAMIDGSNIMSLQFYNKIMQSSSDSAGGKGGLNSLDGGISAAFVKGLGLQEVFGIGSAASKSTGANSLDPNDASTQSLKLNSNNLIIVGVGGTVLILITAFIFFAATFMFLIRSVTLIFLMVLSPLAFMGGVLPALGEITKKWWSQLFNNLLFAPAYMMLLYLVISMITKGGFTGVNGGGSFYQLFSGNDRMIGAVMTFIVLNALMVGCLLIASSFGVRGSKWAQSTGKSWGTSLGGIAGRNTIGRGAARLMQNETVKRFVPNSMMRGLDSVRSAKFGSKSSFMDKQKGMDDKLKKSYDLTAEVRQRSGETDDQFKARKNSAQASAYMRLGIGADAETGLPRLNADGDMLSTTKGKLLKEVRLSASQRALVAAKDMKEEKIGAELGKRLYKSEQDAYDGASKKLRGLALNGASEREIEAQRTIVSETKQRLEVAKFNTGQRDSYPNPKGKKEKKNKGGGGGASSAPRPYGGIM